MDDLDLELELDDALIFELPNYRALEVFRDRLRSRWDGWTHGDEQMWLFAVRLEEKTDLGALLREAQELTAEAELAAIRFCLDGRVYALEAVEADLASKSK